MQDNAVRIDNHKTILPTTHRRLVFASGSPNPIDTQGGKARRELIILPFFKLSGETWKR
jgi:hypothetical protein